MKISKNWAFPLIIAIGISASLVGCASQPEKLQVDLPAKNVAAGIMPLDEYQYPAGEDIKAAYARALLMQPCLNEKGFVQKVPFVDIGTLNKSERNPFDEKRAGEFGYHSNGVVNNRNSAWASYAYRTLKPGEQAALDGCNSKLSTSLPNAPVQTSNFASGLAAAAFDSSLRKSAVVAAESKWRSCMANAGVPDLPRGPMEMPSKSVASKFGLDKPESAAARVVSNEEKKLALRDAQCRQSSGFTKAQYDAEWSAQVEALKKNADALVAAKKEFADFDRRVTTIITQNASKS